MTETAIELKAHYTNLLHQHVKFFGKKIIQYQPVSSHGSDRIIIRLVSEDGTSSIGIISDHTEENKAFISFGRHFRSEGLNVPEIYTVSPDGKTYITEDLGDKTLFTIRNEEGFSPHIVHLYEKVFSQLPKFQITAGKGIDYDLCYQFDTFGEDNIDFDLNYFRERFLKVFYSSAIDDTQLMGCLYFLKHKILELPAEYFLYRDFQSRNIMIKDGKPYFIDFQSGRKGAMLYDAASMLYDAKADIPQELREKLLDHYLKQVTSFIKIDEIRYKEYFWYFAIIRILQAMGAYGYLGIVKNKPRFLESIPYALKNIQFIINNRADTGKLKYLSVIFSEIFEDISKTQTIKV